MNDMIDSYKKGALVSNKIEAVRSLDFDGENLYEGCYTIQIPVVVDKKIQLIECRFKKVVTGGEWVAPDLSEVVHACAQLGEMVRIAVEPAKQSGECYDGDSLPGDHELWLVNEQIKGLLEGEGATEDHESVVYFLLASGLPSGTVQRVHQSLCCSEVVEPSAPSSVNVEASPLSSVNGQ